MPNADVIDDFNEAMQRLWQDQELRTSVLDALAEEGSLAPTLIGKLGFPEADVVVMADMPDTLSEALRAACRQAIRDNKRIQVIFTPAYDHAVQIHDHPTGISITLSMPYPGGVDRNGFEARLQDKG